MTVPTRGTAPHALRRGRSAGEPHRAARAIALPRAPLAYRGSGDAPTLGATAVLDLALCLILASAVAFLLTLAL